MKQRRQLRHLLLIIGLSVSFMSACGKPADSAAPKELAKVSQVTNWFAQPEHGGQYAALEKGFYKEAGLDMTILPGGPQVSAIQQVASGQVQFGMAQADELLAAREEGIPVVAVAAIFQINPQAIMFHAGENISNAQDLSGRSLYIAPGAMYWEYMKKAYDLNDFEEVAFTGNYSGFLADQKSAIQSYVTSDPYLLKQQNAEVSFLRIHDLGYQPYANVLFTTEKMISDEPGLVRSFVEASIKGWEYYKTNYEEINPVIAKANPDLTLESMKATAENEMELIFGGDAEAGGAGTMTAERWTALAGQLAEIGLIDNPDEANNAYTTEFLQ
ncbi:ABC transporter substrate-binding protein [Paenibacillus alkalitolerans]|uniref:ABC transporter substrate-binding protein n=1 Tax=Paenibacillus alkalitolerans TaxID=2799335 RepID=UPI0018F6D656|nr:ABC transporter substrate-binding protein [Paenibacillus alkalitolerans]